MDTENTPPDSAKSNGEHIDAAPAPAAPASGSQPSAAWVPPTVEELQKLLPQYQILQMLGRGGMGAVYKALQTSLDRLVAIKILSGSLQEKEESGFTLRFKNEARAMAKLNHPGIVSVYDFGETPSGLLYIVMEFVDGTDVSKMIASSGRLRSEHAMAITAHVCDALAYAHERGIIHRDIKPANIMVDYEGRVKVADFGLAKVTSSQAQSGLTHSNVIMGTLHYMAPESLILGTELDQRADIYAVGVMLYQMLTGKLPQGLFEMPSLRVPGLDPRYDKIVASALREDRELRYPSAGALRLDLDAILTQPVVKVEAAATEAPPALNTQARPKRDPGQPYRPPQRVAADRPRRKSPSAWWPALVGLVLILGLGGLYWHFQGRKLSNSSGTAGSIPPPHLVTRDMVLAAVAKLCPDVASKATVQQGSDGRFRVDVSGLPVTDFTPLHGLNIAELRANRVPISDLSSVTGVGMATLWFAECPNLTDLSPLSKCVTLRDLNLTGSPVADLAPLRGMPIVSIAVSDTQVKDLTPLKGMPLIGFFFHTADTDCDVSPLSECLSLQNMTIPPSARNIESLRTLPALQRLSHRMDYWSQPQRPMQSVASFWAFYDRMKPWRLQTPAAANTESPDRVCARWALAIGAQVWITGSSAPLISESDIPSKDFTIEKLIFYDGFKKMKEPLVTASDMWRLEGLKELRWLDLRANHVGDAGMTKLGALSSLQTLVLHDCRLTDTSMSVIGQLRQLTRLDLGYNKKITDQGTAHLAYLKELEWLNLYRCSITDKTLTGVLASHPNIAYVEAYQTQVTKTGVQALQRAKPGCNIKSDHPSAPLNPQAPALDPTKGYTNFLGMKFEPVPGTKVMFCIHETRRQDYATYASEVPGLDDSWEHQAWFGIPCGDQDDHPVVGVTWEEAVKFCEWLSKKDGQTYRLPTDEEWSIAVGLGGKEKHGPGITLKMLDGKIGEIFAWEGSFPPKNQDEAGNYADESWHEKLPKLSWMREYNDGYATTAPAMRYKPNKLGLFDMGGNVWEWVEEWYEPGHMRGLRSGSFMHGASNASDRRGGVSNCDIGFRVVLAAESIPHPSSRPAANTSLPHTQSSAGQPPLDSSTQFPPELAALDTQFKALEKERVTVPYEGALAKLNNGYLASLQKAMEGEKAAGRQSALPDLEAEQKRLAAEGSSATAVLHDEDEATAPLVLRNLRTIWRTEHAKLLAARAASLKALVDPLETRLAALEAEFAKANRQADSTKVRTHRDGLGKSLAEASSAAQAAALKAKTSADESPERACARWAVGLSGEVWKAGATSPLKSEADIPKTDFKIEKLVWNDGTAKKGAVSGMDMGRLDGLKGLRWLDVRGQPIGEAGVAKLETLDALETLDLHDCNLTDASLRVISRFRKLTRLDVGNNKDITDQGAAHLSSLTQLEWLNIYGSGVTDQTLNGVLASLPKLKYVEIHGTQVTLLGARAFLKSKPDCLLNAGSTSSATAPKSAPSTPQAATLDPSKGYTNTLGMKFVPVPGLKVMFCIHETRRQDYAAFAKEATGVSESWKNMKIEDIPCGDQDDHPVVGVSWEDAVKFCQWLSAKEGMTYRLPTDAEWSDAVGLRGLENPDYIPERKHAKVEDIYPWEGSYPPKTTDQAGNYADMLWHREFLRRPYISNYRDGYVTTAPVMSFKPNLYGLYDMGGNVWEWVEDLWTKEKGQTDGVLRGGAFDREAVLSSFRYRYRQQWVPSLYAVGFRVVMVVK
jgi:serine/threonine protein kinase/formylglycine-generating enzyme required for sulfatase activity